MALNANALTTLNTVKTLACISLNDTTHDVLFEMLINQASARIQNVICKRDFGRAEVTELLPGTNMQYLPLKLYPIQSITYVKENDLPLTVDVDFYMSAEDAEAGMLYKPDGWKSENLSRGLTEDAGASERTIEAKYIGGYYLPNAVGFTEGADNSLPSDISFVCASIVADQYMKKIQGGQGLKSLSEGGLSYSWFDGSQAKNNSYGILDEYAAVLDVYSRKVFA